MSLREGRGFRCSLNLKKSYCALAFNIFITNMAQNPQQGVLRSRKAGKMIGKKEWKSEKKDLLQEEPIRSRRQDPLPKRSVPSRKDANHYSMFESSTSYILDDLNSIAYANDRIYNLLKVRPRNLWGKLVKCKCSRSKCQARYCQCFSHGQICGIDCSCTNCNNIVESRHKNLEMSEFREEVGCHCSKSQCLKNYCQCFQRGQSCSDKCRCSNCRNFL